MIVFEPIGVIRTPYRDSAPYQPVDTEGQEFRITLDECYREGLVGLEKFRYLYVLFHIDKLSRPVKMQVCPPWAKGREVGLFASRSPIRPNPIGLSIVRIIKIAGTDIYTSGLDVFDQTPLLDIKPYIKDLDTKLDANYGWLDDADDMEHLAQHIKGLPHDHADDSAR
jgi:tRNA-Thr(GGU) m(6)t(6)A37 methyltransferase TsaA